jgi:hypothetical protein
MSAEYFFCGGGEQTAEQSRQHNSREQHSRAVSSTQRHRQTHRESNGRILNFFAEAYFLVLVTAASKLATTMGI